MASSGESVGDRGGPAGSGHLSPAQCTSFSYKITATRTGKTGDSGVVSLKGSSVKGSKGSRALEIGDPTARSSVMSGAPDIQPSQQCDDRRDRGDSIQQVIRLFDETHA